MIAYEGDSQILMNAYPIEPFNIFPGVASVEFVDDVADTNV